MGTIRQQRLLTLLLLINTALQAQKWIPLYADSIPGAKAYHPREIVNGSGEIPNSFFKVSRPAMQVFLPDPAKANHAAILIFPGGGYGGLAWGTEGPAIARAFTEKGIAAFVVKYRLPDDSIMTDKSMGPLQDARRAMQIVRDHYERWNLDTSRIGVIGFSAGGHMAAMLGEHFLPGYRPAFMLLVYPVVSMQPALAHAGSRENLLGGNPDPAQLHFFSAEEQVTPMTPPAYITHTGDDKVVDVHNSIALYEALLRNKIPAELHLYPRGDHGFVLHLPVAEWLEPMMAFLKRQGMMEKILPKKLIVLTFDDAPKSHYSYVAPLLRHYGFGATFYVCEFTPGYPDTTRYMSWPEIRQLAQWGFEIGNHTWHHSGVAGLTAPQLQEEIGYIEWKCDSLQIPRPTSFAYPGYGTGGASLHVLTEMGYQSARIGGDRPYDPKTDNPLLIPSYTMIGKEPANRQVMERAFAQSDSGRIVILTIHGVPDLAHDWVTTSPETFAGYMKWLYDHHYHVISMRELFRLLQ